MFRGMKRLVRAYRERVISLVLLPAFFLAAMPHSACICGDGHRELFCSPGHCRACLSRSGDTAAGGHSCCQGHVSCEARTCCGTKHDEKTPAGDTSSTSVIAKHGCCCKGVVEVPAPAAVSKKSDLAGPTAFVAIVEPATAFVSANELWPSFERISHSTPPPLDAVIVFLHLTI
jgi:hypothetical protein